jgi:hypothetical protein
MLSPNSTRLRSRFSWSKSNKSFVSSSFSVVCFLFFFFSYREVANPAKREGEEERRRRRCASLHFGGWSLLPSERFQIGNEERALEAPSDEEDKKRAEHEQERNESARPEEKEEEVEERSERIIVETRVRRPFDFLRKKSNF